MGKIISELYYHIKGTPNADGVGSAEISGIDFNYIKAKLDYDLGGYSFFTGKSRPRGYYMSFSPIGRGKDSCGYMESYKLFNDDAHSGCIIECDRQSKKKEAEALKIFNRDRDMYLSKFYPDFELELEVAT